MTGFGKSIQTHQDKKITVEVRCLNSKQLDLSLRLPNLYREKENAIRQLISDKIKRGKTDFIIYTESNSQEQIKTINKEIFKSHYKEIKQLATELNENNTDVFAQTFKMPDVFKTIDEKLLESEWLILQTAINEALNEVIEFRKQEGESAKNDLLQKIDSIKKYLNEILNLETERRGSVVNRLRQSLNELLGDSGFDKSRFEQELIYYLEKIDINEEKVRLHNHLLYFEETLTKEDELGRKLGFIAQEIGREINTIGSKANHSEMQKLVVQMKDELEKIKEQVLNIL
jgi:uncharacterized protein (TIGR00255 family)